MNTKSLTVIRMSRELHERLLAAVRGKHPRKSFGYILSDLDESTPTDFLLFDDNIRNTGEWKPEFEAYGTYFIDHGDAGFVATPEEAWRRQKEIWARGMSEIGVFHSHQRHPANFSQIDFDMHVQRFPTLWHMIVSMRNPDMPQIRVFAPADGRVQEVPVLVGGGTLDGRETRDGSFRDTVVEQARTVLTLDSRGRPRCKDSATILRALGAIRSTRDVTATEELVTGQFLAGARERYQEHVAPYMEALSGASFMMGTHETKTGHYVGESPRHRVELSSFRMCRFPVTNLLYALLDDSRQDVPSSERWSPVVNVTWFDAALFALWTSCRLPTEAQWEFACGGGVQSQWCCEDEAELPRYAWFCQNAGDSLQRVASREPNQRGLFDMHGNVWEWCRDSWDESYYGCSPLVDPISGGRDERGSPRVGDRVTRGGSFLSLAEMCRTRYRFHEAPGLVAFDLGFRLVRPLERENAMEDS